MQDKQGRSLPRFYFQKRNVVAYVLFNACAENMIAKYKQEGRHMHATLEWLRKIRAENSLVYLLFLWKKERLESQLGRSASAVAERLEGKLSGK